MADAAAGAAIGMAQPHAAGDMPLLLSGVPGPGRDLVARAVHYLGPRRHRPFVPVRCAALDGTPLETALPGLVRLAEGGTLFLDAIESLSARGQEMLWSLVQAGSESRVRWIAATAVDLHARVAAGAFHDALLDRFANARIQLPPRR
ncbi:hypothetical protein ASF44_23885 [Pseudorhodoferax sp. Leaf274]|nr:hypothetical protein ASF44_23885 [Pseudorhodoferax sp. Leaf274]